MKNEHELTMSIFSTHYVRRVTKIHEEGSSFVHYTGAETALRIIRNNNIWLRNTQCMNDYQEVHHGIDCLVTSFSYEVSGEKFKDALESTFSGITKRITDLFDGWIPALRSSTYIMCVSEHPPSENEYGRLSMWRAYGGKQSVALVFNTTPFYSETDIFHAYTHPVSYQNPDDVITELEDLATRMLSHHDFIKSKGEDYLVSQIFEVFKTYALCSKHPGFAEEREWRIVYNPSLNKSEHVNI